MGENAVSMAKSNYKNTVDCFKRFIGRKFADADVQAEIKNYVHNKVVALENGNVGVEVNYDGGNRIVSMEKLMAMMLTHLKDIAKASIGTDVGSIVLSVPGYWTDSQRRGLLDAVGIAGLNVSRLMNETTASALAYGIYKNARKEFDASVPKNVMFLDCGHSAFSVSIASFVENKLQMKSQAYDRNLGGRDFTRVLVDIAAADFKAKSKCDVFTNPKALIKLVAGVEKAKKSMSPIGTIATFTLPILSLPFIHPSNLQNCFSHAHYGMVCVFCVWVVVFVSFERCSYTIMSCVHARSPV
jgi:heat shock protein 4